MDSLTVYSKEELSSLWNIVKDRFPSQTVWVQKTRDGDYKLAIKKQYTEPFFKIFSKWLHQKIYQTELEKLLFDYHILSAEEHGVIFHSATEKVAESQELMISILLEKIRIITEISSHLKLEGFLQFGIEEYRQKMEDIIEECLENYFLEQDYLEFLELLRYFVEVEECGFGHLSVVAQPDGKYQYFDERMQNITKHCLERFVAEFEEEDPEPNDCLITILILLLPEKVSLYGIENIKNHKFLNTLQNIFGERMQCIRGTDMIANKKM